MSTFAADDFEAIRRHLEELRAEKLEALTGSSAPVADTIGEVSVGWPYMAPNEVNDAARQYLAGDFDPA